MRMLMQINFPPEPFNEMVRKGNVGSKLRMILEEARAEAVYFTEQNGRRGAIVAINLEDQAKIPAYAEPWFLNFNAEVEFRIAMTPADLEKAGLDELGKKWQ